MKNTVKNLITWSPSHLITSPKSAFTLAEVLITLAIIGVVAAMTIPTLVANYQTRTWNTSATVFERKLEEALKVMNTQSTLAGHTSTENFVEELSKHLKITKTCANDKLQDCFSDTVFWGSDAEEIDMSKIKTAKDFGQNDWNTNIIGVQFANGVTGLIAYNPTESCKQDPYSNQIVGTGCLAILYDTTGYKTPNTSLKDLRAVNVFKLGSEIACVEDENGLCWSQVFMPTPLTYLECTEYSKQSGIDCMNPSDYNIDEDTNYWAGAHKTCNDQGGRLPNLTEVTNLVDYLYKDIKMLGLAAEKYPQYLCSEEDENLICVDIDKANAFNFDTTVHDGELYEHSCVYLDELYMTDQYPGLYPVGYMFTGNMVAPATFPATQQLGARCVFD